MTTTPYASTTLEISRLKFNQAPVWGPCFTPCKLENTASCPMILNVPFIVNMQILFEGKNKIAGVQWDVKDVLETSKR